MLGITLLTSAGLMDARRRALRRGVWFRVLGRTEQAIVNLTIRCVDRVRSLKLAVTIVKILAKLMAAMKSRVVRLMETIGCSLAQKIARLAASWGNKEAYKWAEETAFIQYLTIMEISAQSHI